MTSFNNSWTCSKCPSRFCCVVAEQRNKHKFLDTVSPSRVNDSFQFAQDVPVPGFSSENAKTPENRSLPEKPIGPSKHRPQFAWILASDFQVESASTIGPDPQGKMSWRSWNGISLKICLNQESISSRGYWEEEASLTLSWTLRVTRPRKHTCLPEQKIVIGSTVSCFLERHFASDFRLP